MKVTSTSGPETAKGLVESNPDATSLQNLLDAVPDVICSFSKEGRFLSVSAAAKPEWGYHPEELRGSNFLDYVAEADRPSAAQLLKTARNRLTAIRFSTHFRCNDGRSKPIQWSVKWNAKDEVLYGVARDGTELKVAEESAKKYEQRLSRSYQLANQGSWEWNIQGEQIDVADALYELYGISKEQYPVFTTGVYLSLVHPDDLPIVMENVALFWQKPSHRYRHRVCKPSGEIIFVELDVQTLKDENNNVVQVHGTTTDITDQMRQEKERHSLKQQLQQTNHALLMALESMSDGFSTTDRDWTITYLNQRAAEMMGNINREDYIGKNLWACFPALVPTKFYTAYHRAAAENCFVLIEEFYPPLNTWFEVNVYPHADGLSFYIRDIGQRKKQERALFLSNERFRLVAQATSEAIWDWDIETQQVEWGEGFTSLFGYRAEMLTNHLDFVIERLHPDDQSGVVASVEMAIAGTESHWEAEFRFRKADNTYAYVVDKGFIIRDENGHAIRMVGAVQDVTEQKKQERRLAFMAKATSEVIWEREIHADKVMINAEKFQKLFGYAIEGHSFPRSFWLEHIHPQDVRAVHENREYALQHSFDFYLNEYRFQKADGSWAYIKDRTYVVRDAANQLVSLLGAMEDVTTQRLFERALYESEESYRLLFNNGPLPSVICDAETFRILEVNQIAVAIYGYSRDEFLSRTILDFLPEADREKVVSSIRQMQPQGRYDMETSPHVKKSGEQVMVDVSATLIRYKGQAAILATANDVTEKLRLQQQLVEEKINYQKNITKATIEAQEKERSEIGKELHDNVNQMLTAAKLYVENIRHMPAQRDQFVDQSVALLNRTINEVRRLSHILVTPAIQDEGLKSSLLVLFKMFRDLKVFEVSAHFAFDQQQLESGLALTIYRMLQECFSNSVKYAKASLVSVQIQQQGNTLQVVYTDNGVGFDPAAVKKGIGLKNIVNRAEAYRGAASMATALDSGFALQVVFPLKES